MRAKLQRKGVRYSEEYTGFFSTKCRGTRPTSSVEFALRVARARAALRVVAKLTLAG